MFKQNCDNGRRNLFQNTFLTIKYVCGFAAELIVIFLFITVNLYCIKQKWLDCVFIDLDILSFQDVYIFVLGNMTK